MKLSVITINYNHVEGLRKTLNSVRQQTCKDFEYIVVDGGSNDGSRKLIEECSSIINYWVSESDKGIYDAMNKGVTLAKGDFVMFVNSGDILASPDTIKNIINTPFSSDINFFKVKNISSDGVGFGIWCPPDEDKISFLYLQSNPLHHPGAVIRRSIQLKFPYKLSFSICADRCFFMEALVINSCTYSKFDYIVNCMEPLNTSGSSHELDMEVENREIAQLLLPKRILSDLEKSRWDFLGMTQRLSRYWKFSKLIVRIDNILLDLVDSITRKK